MTNAIISKGILKYTGGQSYVKQVTVTFISDEVQGIDPFIHKRYNTEASSGDNGYYDPAENHVKAKGDYSTVIIQGSTWALIDAIVQDLIIELKTKFENLRDSNDLASAPNEQIIDLNL